MEQQPKPDAPVIFTGQVPSLSDPAIQAHLREDEERWKQTVEDTSQPFDFGQGPNPVLRFKNVTKVPGDAVPDFPAFTVSGITRDPTTDPIEAGTEVTFTVGFTLPLTGEPLNVHYRWFVNGIPHAYDDVSALVFTINSGDIKEQDEDGNGWCVISVAVATGRAGLKDADGYDGVQTAYLLVNCHVTPP